MVRLALALLIVAGLPGTSWAQGEAAAGAQNESPGTDGGDDGEAPEPPQPAEPGPPPDEAAEELPPVETAGEGSLATAPDAHEVGAPEHEATDLAYEDPPTPTPAQSAPAGALVRGATVYGRYCAACHGRRGNGRGAAARFLRVPPRDLTTGVYKFRSTESGALATDADLMRTVRRGVPGTAMAGWHRRLPDVDIRAVVHFIKTLTPRYREEEVPAPIPVSARPGSNAEAVERGEMAYVLQRCWTCHGMDGSGNGPAADTLEDDDGNPIEAYDFTAGRFGSGGSPLQIFRTFTTGVNGTPMPSYHEALMVGRDGFEDLSEIQTELGAGMVRRVRTFLRSLPTTEELWALPEAQRRAWADRLRWDLVTYVEHLRQPGSWLRALIADPYLAE